MRRVYNWCVDHTRTPLSFSPSSWCDVCVCDSASFRTTPIRSDSILFSTVRIGEWAGWDREEVIGEKTPTCRVFFSSLAWRASNSLTISLGSLLDGGGVSVWGWGRSVHSDISEKRERERANRKKNITKKKKKRKTLFRHFSILFSCTIESLLCEVILRKKLSFRGIFITCPNTASAHSGGFVPCPTVPLYFLSFILSTPVERGESE